MWVIVVMHTVGYLSMIQLSLYIKRLSYTIIYYTNLSHLPKITHFQKLSYAFSVSSCCLTLSKWLVNSLNFRLFLLTTQQNTPNRQIRRQRHAIAGNRMAFTSKTALPEGRFEGTASCTSKPLWYTCVNQLNRPWPNPLTSINNGWREAGIQTHKWHTHFYTNKKPMVNQLYMHHGNNCWKEGENTLTKEGVQYSWQMWHDNEFDRFWWDF